MALIEETVRSTSSRSGVYLFDTDLPLLQANDCVSFESDPSIDVVQVDEWTNAANSSGITSIVAVPADEAPVTHGTVPTDDSAFHCGASVTYVVGRLLGSRIVLLYITFYTILVICAVTPRLLGTPFEFAYRRLSLIISICQRIPLGIVLAFLVFRPFSRGSWVAGRRDFSPTWPEPQKAMVNLNIFLLVAPIANRGLRGRRTKKMVPSHMLHLHQP